jgi:predicted Zn-dependent peptidase
MRIITLKNNLRVVLDRQTGAQSAYVGVWVKAGSGNETIDEWGISHFTEHMVFKGTKNRTAQQISEETDFVGGQSNAFTSRECTCFYSRTLPENLELSFDILSDIYHNPLLRKSDVDMERGVIKEEISMFEDCPEDLVQDRLLAEIYEGNALGREIAGSAESVDKITSASLADYMKRYYTPDNTVITVCGAFDEGLAESLSKKYFEKSFAVFSGGGIVKPTFKPAKCVWEKDTEQAHLCISYPSVAAGDDKMSYALSSLSNIFGGSMSSRIFRSVREERGLCYSIYSYSSQTEASGLFSIYTGLNKSCLDEAEELIHKEINLLLKDGITDYELQKGKAQLKAAMLMDMENPASRMSMLGKELLVYNSLRTVEEIAAQIDSVTKKDVENAAHMVFENEFARGELQ